LRCVGLWCDQWIPIDSDSATVGFFSRWAARGDVVLSRFPLHIYPSSRVKVPFQRQWVGRLIGGGRKEVRRSRCLVLDTPLYPLYPVSFLASAHPSLPSPHLRTLPDLLSLPDLHEQGRGRHDSIHLPRVTPRGLRLLRETIEPATVLVLYLDASSFSARTGTVQVLRMPSFLLCSRHNRLA
jgi:hypothetical protein